MGLIPLSGRALKYGVKDVNKFLKTYGSQLSKVDNLVSFKKFWETLDPPNQLLLYRALKQTPSQLLSTQPQGIRATAGHRWLLHIRLQRV